MPESDSGKVPGRRALLRGTVLATAVATSTGALASTASAAPADRGRPGDPQVPEPIPQQHPVTEGLLEVPGGALWYWDTGGTGTPVILSHAGTGSALAWPYQQPVLARAGYRVIAYSRRGYYRSSAATAGDPSAVDDLLTLANSLGVDRFHLLGAALGGFVATDFAISHPRRLLSLALVNSQMSIQEPDFVATLNRLRPPEFSNLPASVRELGPSYRAVDPEGVKAWEEISERSRSGPAIPLPKMVNRITWDLLEALPVRTLLTAGDADLYMPPPLTKQVLEHLPNASSLTFSEVGHAPHWERPSLFNSKLLQFLAGARFPEGTRC
ncbi:alpha/beta fold hydrolase [Streptomyces leeuwenhoekii]|uniref:alpha/beta fold hydrolase n=1 Tax=Streptomyces leeuwenhoekii TaxID=1437453 RepID=UPI0036FAD025